MSKEQYFENKNNYIAFEDKAWVTDYCQKNWPEDVNHILRIADDAVEHTFLFDLRWDMERTYEPVHFDQEVDWYYMPGDDPEFIFQFNRHQFFICLGQAYAMTGDEKYAKTFAELLDSWIKNCPLTEETKQTTWRSIEAGIRAETWVKAMSYFKDSPSVDDGLVKAYMDCLTVHAEYLMTTYKHFQIKSNWGVIENRGLMEIALALPISDRTREYLDAALLRLGEEIEVQIADDGVHWEQSPMYHNEVFHCYLEVMRLARRYGIKLSKKRMEKVRQMAYANIAWKKPNHCQPMQGDSDETDIRDLLTQSAWLFADPVIKFCAYDKMDFDGAWDFLKEGIEGYGKLNAQEPDFLDRVMESTGNLFVRSSWEENADYFHFRCGFLGGGHGHSDKLHVDLVINGEDILMDTGRYHYVPGETRTWLKSALGHNVPLIDNQDYLKCRDAWGVDQMSAAYFGGYKKKAGYRYIQGSHGGYLNGSEGNVWITRKVVAIDTDLYLIADEFFSGEKHTYQQLFHFNNHGKVSRSGRTVRYSGGRTDGELTVLTEGCDMKLSDGWISRNYNQMETGRQLLTGKEADGFSSIITVVSGGEKSKYKSPELSLLPVFGADPSVPLDPSDAEAVSISWKGKNYVVILAHRDIGDSCDLLTAGGVKGLGTVIAFDTEKQKVGGTVLHW